jgi:hypothetical protein
MAWSRSLVPPSLRQTRSSRPKHRYERYQSPLPHTGSPTPPILQIQRPRLHHLPGPNRTQERQEGPQISIRRRRSRNKHKQPLLLAHRRCSNSRVGKPREQRFQLPPSRLLRCRCRTSRRWQLPCGARPSSTAVHPSLQPPAVTRIRKTHAPRQSSLQF